MSSIAEFYSKNLSNKVKKGMSEKVKNGGSVGRAPIGYLNVREIVNGRENRTVRKDPERAPLITWAFEQYATGQWTLKTLSEELTNRGLTTVKTTRQNSKNLTQSKLQVILHNPYYTGIVTYQGVEYPGTHTAIVSTATFNNVQTILNSHLIGERTRVHPHYLKSTAYCGQCGHRLLFIQTKNSQGNHYDYFICLGRHTRKNHCKFKATMIYRIEEEIQKLYDHIQLSPAYRKRLEQSLRDELHKQQSETRIEHSQLSETKRKIEAKQRKLPRSTLRERHTHRNHARRTGKTLPPNSTTSNSALTLSQQISAIKNSSLRKHWISLNIAARHIA
ncbi:recombinase family protein [Bifidobacterium crudilactis]|uniref:recombinase family protein n=1 Tax=Bifidobacterium crudilactis TaxID=327277 RepID=UPI00068945B0|nr:recombinase family protein [Bifidobacterium crudilactis]